jgi:signal transduction histidine kinase
MLASIAKTAASLCDAIDATIFLVEGAQARLVARYGRLRMAWGLGKVYPLTLDLVGHRAIVERRTIHVRDLAKTPRTRFLATKAGQLPLGVRTMLATPLLREGAAIGAIIIRRTKVRPFTPKQIALLKTFADQAAIAIENARLSEALEARNADLSEALEQQTATAEILRAISSSPTDIRPVLETLVHAAARFCGATNVALLNLDGGGLRGAAAAGPIGEEIVRRYGSIEALEIPVTRESVSGRAVSEGRTVHIHDLAAEPEGEFPVGRELQRRLGHRTVVATPLLREGTPIGAILLFRTEVRPFSDKQLQLLQAFADQAVIAIENVRLFRELEGRNHDLTEALEQQTATSDILRVISSSPTDLQPVMDAVAQNAARLCGAIDAVIFRVDGDVLRIVAVYGTLPHGREVIPLTRDSVTGRVVVDRQTIHLHNLGAAFEAEFPDTTFRSFGVRTALGTPLLREGVPIGALLIRRMEERPFSEKQIALLQTFADQAVIAIENVRLFKELEARNRDLTEALEQQTATSEILRVISQSPTDVQPVFDAIARSAVRLCDARFSAIYRYDGRLVDLAAHFNFTPEALAHLRSRYPRRLTDDGIPIDAIRHRRVIHVPDVEQDPHLAPGSRDNARILGNRNFLALPILRQEAAIGSIVVARSEPGRFSEKQIELLKTFADQAVIAVENVRLFKELETRTGELIQSVERLTALGEVSHALSSTLDVETVLDTIVSRASQLAGAAGCSIYEYDEAAEQFELRATHNDDAEFVEALRGAPLRKGEGLMGRAAEMREPIQIPDITQPGAYQSSVRDTLIRFGYRALLSVPLLREDQIIGSLSFNRKAPGEFPPEVIEVLKTFATQSALAIQNARLFREIADKSRQLEVASRHKSEFLANMSHELRTPLNAIIGFSEVLNERMFGELNPKQEEYLKDIHASGQHLLSLINDILDLSKIEAGRMELELTDFDLPAAMDNAVTLVRERASRRGVTLQMAVAARVGAIRGDERKIRQVLLNLLSNAIKFTPEGGRIEVRAAPADGSVEVSVSDTGVGIAPEDQEAVFEEFRQVGPSAAKQEGTGLGLALCRKFIELHGGTIRVTSAVGAGSTFTFRLPTE